MFYCFPPPPRGVGGRQPPNPNKAGDLGRGAALQGKNDKKTSRKVHGAQGLTLQVWAILVSCPTILN